MKKSLLLLMLSAEAISQASNLCVGYIGRRFRKHTPVVLNSVEDPKKTCNCNCFAQPRSYHEHKYKCLKCGHRLLPHSIEKHNTVELKPETTEYINAWKQNKFKRDYKQTAEQIIEQEIENIQKLR